MLVESFCGVIMAAKEYIRRPMAQKNWKQPFQVAFKNDEKPRFYCFEGEIAEQFDLVLGHLAPCYGEYEVYRLTERLGRFAAQYFLNRAEDEEENEEDEDGYDEDVF